MKKALIIFFCLSGFIYAQENGNINSGEDYSVKETQQDDNNHENIESDDDIQKSKNDNNKQLMGLIFSVQNKVEKG